MCTVQVLLFAEVVRRSADNGGVRPGVRRVCRRLFADAPASEKEPEHFLKTMEVELRRRDTARWNFDFQRERPLPGRYQWMAVGDKDLVTAVETQMEKEDPNVEIVAEIHPSKALRESKEKRKSSAGSTNQAKITDFLSKRKRPHPQIDESNKLKMRRSNNMTNGIRRTS